MNGSSPSASPANYPFRGQPRGHHPRNFGSHRMQSLNRPSSRGHQVAGPSQLGLHQRSSPFLRRGERGFPPRGRVAAHASGGKSKRGNSPQRVQGIASSVGAANSTIGVAEEAVSPSTSAGSRSNGGESTRGEGNIRCASRGAPRPPRRARAWRSFDLRPDRARHTSYHLSSGTTRSRRISRLPPEKGRFPEPHRALPTLSKPPRGPRRTLPATTKLLRRLNACGTLKEAAERIVDAIQEAREHIAAAPSGVLRIEVPIPASTSALLWLQVRPIPVPARPAAETPPFLPY